MGSLNSILPHCCDPPSNLIKNDTDCDVLQNRIHINRNRVQIENQNEKLIRQLTNTVKDQKVGITTLKNQLIASQFDGEEAMPAMPLYGTEKRLSTSLEKAKTTADMKEFLMCQYKSMDIDSSDENRELSPEILTAINDDQEMRNLFRNNCENGRDNAALTEEKNEMTAQLAHLISHYVSLDSN
eukprot:UN11277